MTALTEKHHAGGFLMSEANGNRSRDNGTLNSGQNLEAGAVLKRSGGAGSDWTAITAGAETSAAAILLAPVDASGGDTPCAVIVRAAEVNGNELVYPDVSPAVDEDAVATALAALGVIVR